MKHAIFFMILSSFWGTFVFAQADLQPAAIVKLTKSEPISVKQFRTEVERMEKAAGRTLTAAERREILDTMINEKLVIQAAERDKITVTENELNQQIQGMKSMLAQGLGRQPTDAEFAEAVKNDYGLDVLAFRNEMHRGSITRKYLMTKKESLFKSMKEPSEEEIKKFFDDNGSEFTRPQTIRLSAVQVPYGTDKTKAKNTAEGILKDIGPNGAKFDEIVMKGQMPQSTYKAADDVYIPRNQRSRTLVGDEFFDAAFALKQGEISKVIPSRDAYYVIKVTATYPQTNLKLDDIYQLGVAMTVHDYIGNYLLQQKQQAILKQATEELVADLRKGTPYQIFEKNLSW